jgi:hypothetical protein
MRRAVEPGDPPTMIMEASVAEKIVNLEELALTEMEVPDQNGWMVTKLLVHRGKLTRLRKNYAALGRETLSGFGGWLTYDQDYSETTARAIVRRVWVCMYEYRVDMAAKIEDERLSWSYRQKLHTDLRKFAAYLCSSEGESDRQLGDHLLDGLARSPFWIGLPRSALIDRYRPRKARARRRREG